MDLNSSFVQFSLFSFPFFLLFLLLPLSIHLLLRIKSSPSQVKARNLPPGPRRWPVIGNIPLFIWKNPHVIVSNLARIHGPLMSLRLGTQVIILGSSPDAAKEILKTHDRDLSGRCAPKATPIKESDLKKFSLLWATDCSPKWKSIRVLWKGELFSNKALEAQACLREKKVAEMVEYLGRKEGEVVKIGEVVFAAVYNTLGNLCFSRDLIGLGDEKMARDWKEVFWRFMECATTPLIADFFPVLDGLGLDFQGKKKQAAKCMKKMFGVWQELIRQRRESADDSKKHGDFLDFMLENGFLDIQILFMLLEILPAGAGTLVATIEWAMAELIKNKEAMIKLEEELQTHKIVDSNSIRESHISQLPYLNACVKETLRLHPPIAFLPHSAQSTCEVMSYTVPENSLVFVNLWAIGHDPTVWEDPFSFRPERFLNSNLDYKGQDFELLPFGAGRRMCPGLPFANKKVHLILAVLVGCFDWSLPDNRDPSDLDMNEKYAVPLQKEKSLLLIPHRKS
ncbi:(S)-N-methylcoclaurine 3'-hydroxylase isozyme 1-like [Sesamum indicum]|uniref:(S)-N-methylcoclaurine 3'-hydroxylase isozyme 1-like n=1 Tax=Sesamum indicum TaxID=4182 RepID=A0A6I9TB90_SESIN|nr:(S)-N-methylcoclaurine 3'-hydroxylase isozyme 1-like [Sesamum indicum]